MDIALCTLLSLLLVYDWQAVLVDAVVAADGESYERGPMETWLQEQGAVSPATGAPLLHTQLVPNHALRRILARMTAEDTCHQVRQVG